MLCFLLLPQCPVFFACLWLLGILCNFFFSSFFFGFTLFFLSLFYFRLQVDGVDNALIKGEIESQWTGLIALLV
jgi:hypothetical protein